MDDSDTFEINEEDVGRLATNILCAIIDDAARRQRGKRLPENNHIQLLCDVIFKWLDELDPDPNPGDEDDNIVSLFWAA